VRLYPLRPFPLWGYLKEVCSPDLNATPQRGPQALVPAMARHEALHGFKRPDSRYLKQHLLTLCLVVQRESGWLVVAGATVARIAFENLVGDGTIIVARLRNHSQFGASEYLRAESART
jgi:hypothetical protein